MGGARQGVGSITYQSLGGPVERYTVHPWRPEFEHEVKHLFLEIDYFLFWGMNKKQDGQGARSARFGVAVSQKRQVRAAHRRARAAKTH
jgi:hypothetical protein